MDYLAYMSQILILLDVGVWYIYADVGYDGGVHKKCITWRMVQKEKMKSSRDRAY